MAIREDLVVSATQFLQDPSVASSTLENRIAFLRTKNLTQEEIDAALARAANGTSVTHATASPVAAAPQQYPPPSYPQYTWQQPPPPVPRRDWRDWFIMATVMGGVGYGLYTLTKRYVYPMIAPPTPERLEQDQQAIQEQFDKAFVLVEQLAKDTEALKAAETERTQRLDGALAELETVLSDIKSSNRRRDDEAQRLRDDIYALKDSIPKAMDSQKDAVDSRLKEVNAELSSLKTLMTQRMNANTGSTGTGNYLRQSTGNAAPSSVSRTAAAGAENATSDTMATLTTSESKGPFSSSSGQPRSSPFTANTGKAAIPAWQLAMAGKSATSNSVEASSSSQSETADA